MTDEIKAQKVQYEDELGSSLKKRFEFESPAKNLYDSPTKIRVDSPNKSRFDSPIKRKFDSPRWKRVKSPVKA